MRCPWVALLLLLSSCGGSGGSSAPGTTPTPGPTAQRGDLVSVTASTAIEVAVVDAYITVLADVYGVDTSALSGTRYRVSLNRVVYKTVTPDGRVIDASGVVAYPLKPAGARSPLLSYQHGTIFLDAEAPSVAADPDPVLVAMAGSGFVVVMPDYVGYAAATNEVHTYIHAQGLAAAVVDLLRAARRVLANNNVATNSQLFLTGYSEGGYATLAAQKEMEQNLAREFSVTASMPAAGPYEVSATAQHLIGLASNPYPEFLSFVVRAYDHWYGWNRINDIFQSPYNTVVATYYDGNHSAAATHAALSSDSTVLFNSGFRSAFLGGGEGTLKADMARNDIHRWAPVTPTRLFHGQDDVVVPYFNATNAATAMTQAGATSVAVLDCTTPAPQPRGHDACVWDYLSQMIGWFVPLAANL
jgi:dienelactone hydrolase